ncbi:MAG: endonuclease/exonuclease/phosphatase family protein [Vicinamibacterales bacterium]
MPDRVAHALSLGIACILLFGAADAQLRRSVAVATAPTFKVATWNIRSGMGVRGFRTRSETKVSGSVEPGTSVPAGSVEPGTSVPAGSWDHETLNCDDRSRAMNAWGIGLPQRVLAELRQDEAIVAVALQEAWNCAAPERVNEILGFATASREVEGVALLARHGVRGSVRYARLDAANNRWVVGADVCLDEACQRTVPVYSTHFGSAADELTSQARAVVELLRESSSPHLLLGDLNVYEIDRWSPWVPCAGTTRRSPVLDVLRAAGYRDAWVETQAGAGWTGMASRPDCGSPQGMPFKRIDYVLTRGVDVIATSQFAAAMPGGDAPSDHRGLIAELVAPNP